MLLVCDAGGVAIGAAVLTLPAEPEMPPDVAIHRDELWRALGPDARARYETYANACKAFAIAQPHHHLNMIGVRRAHAGHGVGRVLLDAVRELAAADPGSAGVSLTTERARNVELYEHVGYAVTGHVRIDEDLETWGMFMDKGA
jgi:GNAT superfamily N-acetyltransferase